MVSSKAFWIAPTNLFMLAGERASSFSHSSIIVSRLVWKLLE
ncbi:hypothetical protein CUZ93_2826 [Enterococcus xinjiangensis]|nr:hypothetical protein [Enterococcus faecium]MBL4990501.1 hypothetical protein [Enterococcus lactis]MBK4838562.1 hypothetical protein [Enterococcus faecium]MBK4840513.1 hypothetical protein [Enterococcus faecium]MBK4844067.1 hypothetical protein [Enterococcus faecium]